MQPLTQRRILITRTRKQASALAEQLEALGAIPISIPTIEIVPPETYAPLDAALTRLQTYNWLLFTSINAVEAFHQRLSLQQANQQFSGEQNRGPHQQSWRGGMVGIRESEPSSPPRSQNFPRIAAIGPATARAAESLGLTVDLIPPKYIAESLAEALLPHAPNANILFPRAAEARDHLPETLRKAGANVTIIEAYRNQIPPNSIPELQSLFRDPASHPDAITFTSASTARNLAALLEAANLTLPPTTALASIGPITTQTLRDLGHTPTIEAKEPTIPSLIQSLIDHFNSGA